MRLATAIGASLLTVQAILVPDCALAATAPGAASFAQWAGQNIHPAVARIVAPGDGSISYGSGTLIYSNDQYGLVVTNWHVVNEATGPISVHFPDGFYSLGTVQTIDHDWDLAAIAIRKPNAAPVALANRAPRPGEMLTIAGYGSGQYRAASGPCTQYVAPGLQFPYEMVELAATARQGDSGGPIFNDQGELAGVLFGEGNGRTSGSYCGRVRWFLSRVVPQMSNPDVQVAAAPSSPLSSAPPASIAPGSVAPSTVAPPPLARVDAPPMPPVASSPAEKQWHAVPQPAEPPPVASTHAPGQEPEIVQLTWRDVAGDTWGEQAKTVLAGIGVLALILQILRWVSREEAAA